MWCTEKQQMGNFERRHKTVQTFYNEPLRFNKSNPSFFFFSKNVSPTEDISNIHYIVFRGDDKAGCATYCEYRKHSWLTGKNQCFRFIPVKIVATEK